MVENLQGPYYQGAQEEQGVFFPTNNKYFIALRQALKRKKL